MPDDRPVLAVSAVTTCKGRLAHLQASLPALAVQPFAEVIVVDYDCPERAGDWAEAAFPAVKVVRAPDRPVFNVAKARNLGARAATAPWLLFVDADVILAPDFCTEIASRLEAGVFAVAQPLADSLWGTFLVARADFEAVGGFDEVFEGWGSEDAELFDRLERLGRRRVGYDAAKLTPIAHGDDVRMRYYEAADARRSGFANDIYRMMKTDLTRQGRGLDEAARRSLYDQVRRGLDGGMPATTYGVGFRDEWMHGLRVRSSLKYQVQGEPGAPDERGRGG